MSYFLEMEKLLANARALVQRGQYDAAIKAYQELMALPESRNEKYYVSSISEQANCYGRLGQPENARDCYLHAIHTAENRKSAYLVKAFFYHKASVICVALGDYETAEEYETHALELLQNDPTSDLVPVIFNNIGLIFIHLGRYDEALDFLTDALKMYEETAGPDGVVCYETLSNLGLAYGQVKDYRKAVEYSKRALAIQTKAYGENYPGNIHLCIDLGIGCAKLADYETALNYLFHALELLKKTGGLDHPLCASCYEGLGGVYFDMGNYTLALEYFQKSLAVLTKTKGENHPDTAYAYANLSGVYQKLSDYEKALEYISRSLKIRKDVLGEHPDTANAYSSIGYLYGDMGNYADALIYSFHALAIREKVLNPKHPDIGASLNQISWVYSKLHDYRKCSEYQLRELEFFEKAYGAEHPEVAERLNNLSVTCAELGEHEQALKLALLALKIDEKALGENHPMVAEICDNIGNIYRKLRGYDEALRYEKRAMDITEQVFGLEHLKTVRVLQSTCMIYYELGEHEKGLECILRALEIQQKKYSPNHSAFIDTYYDITLLYYKARNANAVKYAKKLMESLIQGSFSVFYIPQEDLRLTLLNERRTSFSLCFSVVFSNLAQFDENELYSFELSTKNLVAETSFVQSSFAHDNKKPEYAAKYSSLKQLRNLYAKYILEGFPENTKRENLERLILDNENVLSLYYREIDFKLHMQKATPDAIRGKLPNHAALLEYGRYHHFSAEPFSVVRQGTTDSYFVFVLTKDAIHLFDLADCGPIDALIDQVRMLLTDQKDAGEVLRSLYKCLIGPVENDLAGIDQLFIAPDSELFILPFELLQNEAGERLSERIPAISYLSTGRDLLRSSNNVSTSPFKDIAIIADPKFDLDDGGFSPSDADIDTDRSVPPRRSRDVDEYLKASAIQRLPFTSVEADLIAGLFSEDATVQRGSYATKSSIRQLGPSSVVHLSTHGFALALQNADIPQKRNLFGRTERGSQLMNAENPMLRCGLAFAGICNWLNGEILPVEIGDGILNGMDVLSLDLSNTNLMVLSACQTGLGDTQSGEGIQGMRRAFELAGVHTLICTLWKVDDLASAILMTAFYKKLLENKLSKTAALSAAKEYTRTLTPRQLELDGWGAYVDDLLTRGFEKEAMRLQDALDDEPDATPFAHPYYWAGFVLQGEA